LGVLRAYFEMYKFREPSTGRKNKRAKPLKKGGKFEFQTLTAIFGRKMASYQKMFFLT